MKNTIVFYIGKKLTKKGDVNNTLYINNKKIKDYEVASFSTSNFS